MWKILEVCENAACSNNRVRCVIDAITQTAADEVARQYALYSKQVCPTCGQSLFYFPEEQ